MESLDTIKINDVEILKNINLQKYTTIKLARVGQIAICKTEKGLINLIETLHQKKIKYRLVGWGANQVLHNVENTLCIKLDFKFDKSQIDPSLNLFELPASTNLNQLTSLATKYGFSGWEVFTGVPGSLGGAICMNAGTSLGEIGELVESVRVLRSNLKVECLTLSKESFVYRNNTFLKQGDIILSAKIRHFGIDTRLSEKITKYLDYRKATQPLTTRNCGSVFKNHSQFKAGIVIDRIGLKGFGTDNGSVSLKHGNFIENNGEGSSDEFIEVVNSLKEVIERFSGLKFELEVKVY